VGVPQAEGLRRLAVRSWRVVHHGSGRGDSGPVPRYSNAIGDELEDTSAVFDALHVVKLGLTPMERTRRRLQQEQLGHRGRKHDPLYRIRNTLPCQSRAAQRPSTRAERGRSAGRDPNFEVTLACRCYQQLRSAYHTKASPKGQRDRGQGHRRIPHLPHPRDRPIGPHPACLEDQFLAYFSTARASNGGTEAVNVVESTAASHADSAISTTIG
jgi:transposase